MTAAFKFLGQMTDVIFESHMQRAANKICRQRHVFSARKCAGERR
jgi:hypothetical protein